jgi:serine/threonine-protein kinase
LGRVLLNQYVIRERLGEGGFGAVYLAEQPSMQRYVAIKTLHSHVAQRAEVARRFQREGAAASRITHPAAVKMFNLGQTEDGLLWLAMEFVEGEPLSKRLARGPLSPTELVEILGPICDVLDEAHEKGIIHRDLKPENIMLTARPGGKFSPKLLDFGLAALLLDEGPRTKSGVISGTPAYMAPEQWQGLKNADARTDIYALGIIAYRALSGRFPFTADTAPAWLHQHCFEDPFPIEKLVRPGEVSAAMCRALMSALEKDPNQRPQSAGDFFSALRAALPHALPTESLAAPNATPPRNSADPTPVAHPAQALAAPVQAAPMQAAPMQAAPMQAAPFSPVYSLEGSAQAASQAPTRAAQGSRAALPEEEADETRVPVEPSRRWLWIGAASVAALLVAVLAWPRANSPALAEKAPAPGSDSAAPALVEKDSPPREEAGPREAGPREAGPREAGPRGARPLATVSPVVRVPGEVWISAVASAGGIRAQLPPEEIERAFGSSRSALVACYEPKLAQSPGLSGAVVLSARVSASGTLSETVVGQDPLGVGLCAASVLDQMQIEGAGVPLSLSVELNFNPE